MTSPNSVFTEIVSTTFRNHRGVIADNVSKHNALYRMMKKNGRTRTESGGYSIVTPLEYTENSTYQRYSGLDTLNVAQSDVFSAAEYNWKQVAIHVVSSGLELRQNSGPQRIANLAKARIQNAIHTFANNFSSDMYSDGSATNQIDGIQKIVADTPTNTVGGISSNTYTFWKNKVQSAAAPLQGGGAITYTDAGAMEKLMLGLLLEVTRNADRPDIIVSTNDYYLALEAQQSANRRYVDADMADVGFMALQYHGIPVIFDGGSGMPAATRMYFLNTKYLELVVHSDANLTVMDEVRPFNQDGVVVPILWMGNFVCSNRKLQGVIKP